MEDWLNGHGIQLDRSSKNYKTLAHRFLKIMVTATDKQAQRLRGEVVDTPPCLGEVIGIIEDQFSVQAGKWETM